MLLTAIGKYHTILCQEVVGAPGFVVPVLYLQQKDGSITINTSLHEFLLSNRSKSLVWKRYHARASGLFWDFLRAIEDMAINWNPINIHNFVKHFSSARSIRILNKTHWDFIGHQWICPAQKKSQLQLRT